MNLALKLFFFFFLIKAHLLTSDEKKSEQKMYMNYRLADIIWQDVSICSFRCHSLRTGDFFFIFSRAQPEFIVSGKMA